MTIGSRSARTPAPAGVGPWLCLAAAFAIAGGCAAGRRPPVFANGLPAEIPADAPAIAVVGDLQMTPAFVRRMRGREDNREPQRRLLAHLTDRADRFGALVIVGDLVFTARSARAWRHFDSLVGPVAASLPVLPAIGNHDYHCVFVQLCWQTVVPKRYRTRFPWVEPGTPYFVRWGRLGLVFLDSETNLSAQAAWLRQRLAAMTGDYDAALVFFHRPPYSDSIDAGAHGDAAVQQLIVPVLRSAPLTSIVFNGHVHGYEHLVVDGLHYFTTAGGGGPRGLLGPDRADDAYAGPDCYRDPSGAVRRPFNYLRIAPQKTAVRIDVTGFCRGDEVIGELESVLVPYDRR